MFVCVFVFMWIFMCLALVYFFFFFSTGNVIGNSTLRFEFVIARIFEIIYSKS